MTKVVAARRHGSSFSATVAGRREPAFPKATIIAASSLSGSRPHLMDYATSKDCHLNITRAFAAFLVE